MARLRFGTDFKVDISRGGYQQLSGRHDDGTVWTIHLDVVFITLNDGREFYLPNGRVVWSEDEYGACQTVKGEYNPRDMEYKVIEQGVNLHYWVEIEKQPTLQSILSDEWVREQEERMISVW